MTDSTVKTIDGDLLYADVDMIIQQCNCLTKTAHGLSQSIKDVLNVDPYGHRRVIKGRRNCAIKEDQGKPGTTTVYDRSSTVKNPRYVACLFAQFSPGKPGIYHQDKLSSEKLCDDSKQRLEWFQMSLMELTKVLETIIIKDDPEYENRKEPFKVAFPYLIGCGLAGGKWENYKKAIEIWASNVTHTLPVQVLLVHKK